jgi:hypothetical protein
LGVFIFELTAGYSPFAGATRDKMFRNIIAANLAHTNIPKPMDPRCADLVSLLLVKDEEARLGMGEEGWDGVKVGGALHCTFHNMRDDAVRSARHPCVIGSSFLVWGPRALRAMTCHAVTR